MNDKAQEYAGLSLIRVLEKQLEEDVRRYLEMIDVPIPNEEYWTTTNGRKSHDIVMRQRGIVRGTARALALWYSVYEKKNVKTVQEIEKLFVRKAKS